MTKTVTQDDIESILASMNRSADTLQCASRSDTFNGANRNIINCRNWLKDHGIAYQYDHKSRTYKLGTGEVEGGNNQT